MTDNPSYSRADFAREPGVSRETLALFDIWEAELRLWNRKINLVSPKALDGFWGRHALDSWQVVPQIPEIAQSFIDLGSGAGFPGLAIAIARRDQAGTDILLTDSAGKKANFLRSTARKMGLKIRVSDARIENLPRQNYDVISARAFAPLPRLLTYAQPFWSPLTIGLFLKGESADQELTQAAESWTFDVEKIESQSQPGSWLLKITNLSPR